MKKASPMAGMDLRQKLHYIWDYYKLAIFGVALLLYILIYAAVRILTHRDPSLYIFTVNVHLSETGTAMLDPEGEAEIVPDLVLVDGAEGDLHQMAYASRLKILASIDAELLDVVVMDRTAMEAFASEGYLLPLEDVFGDDPGIREALTVGTVILSDNSTEAMLDESVTYQAVTQDLLLAVDLSGTRFFEKEGFPATVYIGILRNTPRMEEAEALVRRLFSE